MRREHAGESSSNNTSSSAAASADSSSINNSNAVIVTQHPALVKHKKKYSGEAVPIRLDSDGEFTLGFSPSVEQFWPASSLHRRDDSGGLLLPTDNAQDYEEESTCTSKPASSCAATLTFHQPCYQRTSFVAPPSNTIKALNSLTLFGILYASSVGSGYGFEDSVGLAGPLLVTIFCTLLPWIWCLPNALAVSELATAIPSNAGFLAWSYTAFSPVVTHFNVICTLVITFIGNAAYPALFAHYVSQYFGKAIESTGQHRLNSAAGGASGSLFAHGNNNPHGNEHGLFDSSNHHRSAVSSSLFFSASSPPTATSWSTTTIEAGAKIVIVVGAAVLNCFGVSQVGGTATTIAVLATLPFVLMTFLQLTATMWREVVAGTQEGFDFTTITYVDWSKVDWAAFLSVLSWNYSGYEGAATVIEEVNNPQKALPRAFVPLMMSTYVTFLLPVWAGVSVFSAGREQHWNRWTTGYWNEVSFWIGGVPLQNLMRAGGVLVGVGFMVTNICTSSRTLAGIGQIGALPKPIGKLLATYHPRLGTPVAAITVNAFFTLLLSLIFSRIELITLTQVLYMLRMLMMYAALIALRKAEPTLRRPFCIPLSLKGLYWMLAPAVLFSVLVLCVATMQSSSAFVLTAGFLPAAFAVSYFYVNTIGFSPAGLSMSIMKEPDPNDDSSLEKSKVATPVTDGVSSNGTNYTNNNNSGMSVTLSNNNNGCENAAT